MVAVGAVEGVLAAVMVVAVAVAPRVEARTGRVADALEAAGRAAEQRVAGARAVGCWAAGWREVAAASTAAAGKVGVVGAWAARQVGSVDTTAAVRWAAALGAEAGRVTLARGEGKRAAPAARAQARVVEKLAMEADWVAALAVGSLEVAGAGGQRAAVAMVAVWRGAAGARMATAAGTCGDGQICHTDLCRMAEVHTIRGCSTHRCSQCSSSTGNGSRM